MSEYICRRKLNKLLPTFFLAAILGILIFQKAVYAYDDVVVVIDPGHGGPDSDNGAETGAVYDGFVEKDINLITSLALRDELESYPNISVYLTREDDTQISLEDRIAYAKSVNADVVVSVHYNASSEHLFYGGEIFVSAEGRYYAQGYDLADCIKSSWTNAGRPFKGIKTRINDNNEDYYGIIRHGKQNDIPTIILEHSYLDNHIDTDVYGTTESYRELGRLDAEGIAAYYGLVKGLVLDKVNRVVKAEVPNEICGPDKTEPKKVSVVIDEIDRDLHTIRYTIEAVDNESRLIYYGIGLGMNDELKDEDYADLVYWDSDESSITGVCEMPSDYDGYVTFRVYNSYELYKDSDAYYVNMTSNGDLYSKDNNTSNALPTESQEDKGADSLTIEGTSDEASQQFEPYNTDNNPVDVNREDNSRISRNRVMSLVGFVLAGICILIALIVIAMILIRGEKDRASGDEPKDKDNFDDYY